MKRLLFFVLASMVSLTLWSWENQDWLTEYSWYLTMDYRSPNHYDWHSHKTPDVEIKRFAIPQGSSIYRRLIRKDFFKYFYQTPQVEKNHIFWLGLDMNDDGKDDELIISERGNYSRISIKEIDGFFLNGGERIGGMNIPGHPLVGIWGKPDDSMEFRLVEPAEYIYHLEISKEIPGFAMRYGTYLFRQVGDTVFETDPSFPDGYMRLEIRNLETLVLIPLFTLPDEKGFVEPVLLKRIPKGSQ